MNRSSNERWNHVPWRTAPLASGDLLLFRGSGLVSRLIAVAGRAPWTHAAKLWVCGDTPLVLEVREWYGGRIVTLESQVARYPGRIDVFRLRPGVAPSYDIEQALDTMRRLAGKPYGYWSVLRAALMHLLLVRMIVPPDLNDAANGDGPVFCSQAVALADRAAGYDPVPNLADRLTSPADLAHSYLYEYRCTLVA